MKLAQTVRRIDAVAGAGQNTRTYPPLSIQDIVEALRGRSR